MCQVLAANTAIRVAIFTGKGKSFCAGADLSNPPSQSSSGRAPDAPVPSLPCHHTHTHARARTHTHHCIGNKDDGGVPLLPTYFYPKEPPKPNYDESCGNVSVDRQTPLSLLSHCFGCAGAAA